MLRITATYPFHLHRLSTVGNKLCRIAPAQTVQILLIPTGTACRYFDEVTFRDELMTSYYEHVSIDISAGSSPSQLLCRLRLMPCIVSLRTYCMGPLVRVVLFI